MSYTEEYLRATTIEQIEEEYSLDEAFEQRALQEALSLVERVGNPAMLDMFGIKY